MSFIRFMHAPAGRLLRVAIGALLLWYGAGDESLLGLMAMMLGLVPVVTGIVGVCLVDEIVREYRESRAAPLGNRTTQPSERHV
jgi:hypothetical protein